MSNNFMRESMTRVIGPSSYNIAGNSVQHPVSNINVVHESPSQCIELLTVLHIVYVGIGVTGSIPT